MTKVNNRIAEKATGLASNCLTVLPITSLALDTVFNTLIPLPSAPPPSSVLFVDVSVLGLIKFLKSSL